MITIKIEGLEELTRKLRDPKLLGGPLKDAFTNSVVLLERDAKAGSPVDTGRLRSSITHQVDSGAIPLWGKVGTDVFYAPYMEFGTGKVTDGTGGKGRHHWPPSGALDLWARRHGIASGYLVARAIGRRGGLKPRRMFRKAFEKNLGAIRGFFSECAQAIEARWGKK